MSGSGALSKWKKLRLEEDRFRRKINLNEKSFEAYTAKFEYLCLPGLRLEFSALTKEDEEFQQKTALHPCPRPKCTRPQLNPKVKDLQKCAACFARAVELQQGPMHAALKKLHYMLNDLPYLAFNLDYAVSRFYDKASPESISKVGRNYMITKLSGLLIITRSKSGKGWTCCKNRVDALNLDTVRKIINQKYIPPLPAEDEALSSRADESEIPQNQNGETVYEENESEHQSQSVLQRETPEPEADDGMRTSHNGPKARGKKRKKKKRKKKKNTKNWCYDCWKSHHDGEECLEIKSMSEIMAKWIRSEENRFQKLDIKKRKRNAKDLDEPALCLMCETRPQLSRNVVKYCAVCFAHKADQHRLKNRPDFEELLSQYRPMLIDLPYDPVPLLYATKRYYNRLGLSGAVGGGISPEEQNFVIENLSGILVIVPSRSIWYCCRNRVDAFDLQTCRNILSQIPIQASGTGSGDGQNPRLQGRRTTIGSGTHETPEDNERSIYSDSEVGSYEINDEPHENSSLPQTKPKAKKKYDGQNSSSLLNRTNLAEEADTNKIKRKVKRAKMRTQTPQDHNDEAMDEEGDQGVPDESSYPTYEIESSSSDSDMESIENPRKRKTGIKLDKSTESVSGSRHAGVDNSPNPPQFGRFNNRSLRTRGIQISYAETSDTDSDYEIRSKSSSSSEDESGVVSEEEDKPDSRSGNNSDSSSGTSCSDASENEENEQQEDSDIQILNVSDDEHEVQLVSSDPKFQPVVVLESNSELEAKLKSKKLTGKEWKNLERERDDYEEKFLGNIEFSQCSLDYAIDAITKALNWNVFPFGSTILNRGRITKHQKKNPDGEEWHQIKQEFMIRHFKTALSITPWRGKWFCCKNRVDKLNFKEYLQRFWKIDV